VIFDRDLMFEVDLSTFQLGNPVVISLAHLPQLSFNSKESVSTMHKDATDTSKKGIFRD
jgi:hypothetical protein